MAHLFRSLFTSITVGCKGHATYKRNLQVLQLMGKKIGKHWSDTFPRRFKSYQLSYVHGVGDTPLKGVNVGYYVDRFEERFADREAVVDVQQNLRVKFHQFKQDIDQFATGLLSLQLNKGDSFGIWCPNRYEWFVGQLAANKAGLIMKQIPECTPLIEVESNGRRYYSIVPLNPNYQVPEMEYSLKKLEIKAVLMQESFRTQNYYEMMKAVVPEVAQTKPGSKIKSAKHPNFNTLIMFTDKDFPGTFKYKDIARAGGSTEKQKLDELQSKIQSDDTSMIIFTSGTTGSPKGVVLTHHNIINACYVMEKRLKHHNQLIRICCPVPLFHSIGCIIQTTNMSISGLCAVLPSQGYDVGKTLKAIEEEKCTSIIGSPTMFVDFLHHPDFSKTNLSSLNRAIIGGAPCPPQLRKDIMKMTNISELLIAYGSTEVSGGLFATFPDHKTELESNGWIYDYMECKVIDKNGQIVPIDTIGEICARGFKVMKGYWQDEEKTKEVLSSDGWYKTGDLGALHENGTLSVTGRLTDMILRGGANVYPREIEDVLMTNPKIAEAQVVGVPDERLGEQVCAWILLKPNQSMTENELKDFCKDKMTYYKIPHYIRFVSELPKTLSGKVKKYVMKEEMIKILGLKELE